MYRNKSIPLERLMPCFTSALNSSLIELHCLQFGADGDQLNPWRHMDGITDWKDDLRDFSDTAHLVQQLDLVICVDTAVAHLAGALNRPTWLFCCHITLISVGFVIEMIHPGTHPCVSSRQTARNDWSSVVEQLNRLSTSCSSSTWRPLLLPKV